MADHSAALPHSADDHVRPWLLGGRPRSRPTGATTGIDAGERRAVAGAPEGGASVVASVMAVVPVMAHHPPSAGFRSPVLARERAVAGGGRVPVETVAAPAAPGCGEAETGATELERDGQGRAENDLHHADSTS
ncbi:hypothetical protein [Methylobacterium planeticum]|uniref:hypothetical protein n=1 Tax=Methylobacterium planeticum TaxID=2615211 RepID=UPI001786BD9D|nr:hypothetical protein [Methylobacterium planeticum]